MLLDDVCRDLTSIARSGRLPNLAGRETELRQLAALIGSQEQRSVLITGEPGVGKSALVEGLAVRIATNQAGGRLADARLLQLDLNGLVAGTMYRGELESRVQRLISEASSDPRLILFIDEFHTITHAGGQECHLADALKPALARGELSVIGATTTQQYRQLLEQDAALIRRFAILELPELSREATLQTLRDLSSRLSSETGVTADEEVLEAVVDLTARYLRDRALPDRAILALRRVFADASLGGSGGKKDADLGHLIAVARKEAGHLRRGELSEAIALLEQCLGELGGGVRKLCVTDIKRSLAELCRVPLDEMDGEGFDRRVLGLEPALRELVVGQDRAVAAVAACFKRTAVGLRRPNAPIGSFLFAGPTGVGKTELARALADVLWGNRDRMIRFDMSEYMEEHTVSRLLGAPAGYVGHDEPGLLTQAVSDQPYSVVLVDEIEKAHPRVANILLQILEDGRLTDAKGRTVSFRDTVVVLTSNVGAAQLAALGRERIEDHYETVLQDVRTAMCSAFSPELVNRLDQLVVFSPLLPQHLERIFDMLAAQYSGQLRTERGISVSFSESARQWIIARFHDPAMGARPLRRGLEAVVFTPLSDHILRGEFGQGDEVQVDIAQSALTFRRRKP